MAGPVKRATRVGSQVHEELARVVQQLSDPRLVAVVLTRVDLTPDLRLAKVYVQGPSPDARQAVLKALGAAAPRLRREMGLTLGLRYVPELKFYFDDGLVARNRVEELLREIEDEKKT